MQSNWSPKFKIYSSTKIVATVLDVVSFNGTATAYFVLRFEISKKDRACDFFANVTGPKMSAVTMKNGVLVSMD